ncbi:MAG: hypothetical protein WA691_04185 [Thermoplasmata archaeon]
MLIPPALAFGELVLLFLIPLPLGAITLRLAERFLGHGLGFSPLERVLVAFFAAGTILFVFAALPVAWYGWALISAVFGAGMAAFVVITLRERGAGLRPILAFMKGVPGLLLVGGTLGLVALELLATWTIPFPNTYDGASTAVWVNLLLANHTMPWTLAPYANWGVAYPFGAVVWMSIPVALFGWPITGAPVLLPPLFLALTVPSAYALGSRVAAGSRQAPEGVGLLFAGFFGLVTAWPRLFVGGSYDFIFVTPLFLISLGCLPGLLRATGRNWKDLVGVGAFVGAMVCLGTAAAEFLILVLVAYLLMFRREVATTLRSGFARIVGVALIGSAFMVRTLVALAVWYPYPGHVLTEAGQPPYATPVSPYQFGTRLVTGELDPFVLWKAKLSPFPAVSIELQLLLAVGIVLLLIRAWSPQSPLRGLVSSRLTHLVAAGTATGLLLVAFLLATTVPGSSIQEEGLLASLEESSEILFLFFCLIALVPLIAAVELLRTGRRVTTGGVDLEDLPSKGPTAPTRTSWHYSARRPSSGVTTVLVLVLLIPLGSGAYTSVVDGPGYLHGAVTLTASVTPSDADALRWAGANLPGCSRVLVAPGSAAEFLPEFARVSVVYPMLPAPVNLSYALIVAGLILGQYNSTFRAELVQLEVTEVFGTGMNSASYLPFDLQPLATSSDFHLLFQEGDASIYEFLPGATASGCAVA